MGIVGWALFGCAVRWWQLGIEMRPFFHRRTWVGYPIFASISGALGYYIDDIEKRQTRLLEERKQSLLEKRRRYGLGAEQGVGQG